MLFTGCGTSYHAALACGPAAQALELVLGNAPPADVLVAISHEGEECGLILSGRLQVTVGEKSAILRAGDAYYFRSNQPHSFLNPGSEPCELITACTPPSF